MYDDGFEDDFKLPQTLLLNNRSAVLVSGLQTARRDGWIVSGQMQQQPGVANQATQRGQCYVKACIVSGIDPGTTNSPTATIPQCRAMVCCGYIYSGVEVSVGQLIEPGPAGGPGAVRSFLTADPGAGLEVADQTVLPGLLWLLRAYTVQIVQGLTQTPLPSLEFENADGTVMALIPAMTTALGVSTTAQLTWAIGLAQTSFVAVAGDEQYTAPLPVIYLNGTFDASVFATFTDGIGANTNYGAARVVIEEWVMPN